MPELKTSNDWYEAIKEHIQIRDADGWDRANYQYSFYEEKITKDEFNRRLSASTISGDWSKLK